MFGTPALFLLMCAVLEAPALFLWGNWSARGLRQGVALSRVACRPRTGQNWSETPRKAGSRGLKPNFVLYSIAEAESLAGIGNNAQTADDRKVCYEIKNIAERGLQK